MNYKYLFYTVLFMSFFKEGFGQIRILEPVLGNTPDISTDAAAKLKRNHRTRERVDSIVNTYPDFETAKKHLTERQLEIYSDEEEYNKEDHLEVGPFGCSWYCGGGPDSVFASSALPAFNNLNYVADNAHDFSLRTAWVEGVKGFGIGQSITYRFQKKSPPVTTVKIYNGYMKSEKTWKENARVKKLKFYINNKPYAILHLQDTHSCQEFDIGSQQGIKADLYFRFEILEVYKGDKFEDTSISEIEFDGTGVH